MPRAGLVHLGISQPAAQLRADPEGPSHRQGPTFPGGQAAGVEPVLPPAPRGSGRQREAAISSAHPPALPPRPPCPAARVHLPPPAGPPPSRGRRAPGAPGPHRPSEQRSRRRRCGSYICAPGRTMQGRPRCPGSMFPAGRLAGRGGAGRPRSPPPGLAAAGGSGLGLRAECEVRAPRLPPRQQQFECGLDRCASDRAESHVTARPGPT